MSESRMICIVDDNVPVGESMVALANAFGYQAESYLSGEQLLADHRWDQFGCLLIDFNMPGLNGLEILRELQTRSVRIPTLIVSGHVGDDEILQLKAAGASEIVYKPVRAGVLMKMVGEILQRQPSAC